MYYALSVGDKRIFLSVYLSISRFLRILDSHLAPYATCEVAQSWVRRCSGQTKKASSELSKVDANIGDSFEAVQCLRREEG